MAKAIQAAVSAVGSENLLPLLDAGEIETVEQLGRDYWVAEDAKARAERSLGQCDVSLFDFVKGRDYVTFIAVRSAYVTGCRDKGAPTDEAAAKVWERAINRIVKTCGFERPKAESKAAKAMSEKRAKQIAQLQAKTDTQLELEVTAALEDGSVKALREAAALRAEQARREKPVLDAEATARKAVLDKLLERARELAKAKTADADSKLQAALLALS
jgi:Skp family chaperone for outer membrane proteins